MSRLTDNDRNFGPITIARWKNRFHFGFSSGSTDDGCAHFLLVAFGWAIRLLLPSIIRPTGKYREYPTEFSISLSNMGECYNFLSIHYGRQTHDSSTTRSWCKSLPWTQWTHVRHTIYMPDGTAFYSEGPKPNWRDFFDAKDFCPKLHFNFQDYDGAIIIATCMIEEREWRKGAGWFKWLRWFSKPKIRRSLDLAFNKEVGPEKGSWKGGTVGHGIDMLPDESIEAAFRRYCSNEHSSRGKNFHLAFIGPCDAPPPKVYPPAPPAEEAKSC